MRNAASKHARRWLWLGMLPGLALGAPALEEVLVTATKRESSLQDVSVAVTALSAQDIANAQITSSEQLTFLVPSLNLQKGNNPRQTSFSIRGIGTQSFSSAVEPSVSTMVDGVVMGRSGQAFMQLLDVERVEVLRGPQGTLFGKNSTAGVVHVITRDPTEAAEGEIMTGIINGGEYRAGGTVSGPVNDKLGFRLSANGKWLGSDVVCTDRPRFVKGLVRFSPQPKNKARCVSKLHVVGWGCGGARNES